MKSLVLRYGEINLKGNNRKFFERSLISSIKKKTKGYNCRVQTLRNRTIVEVDINQADELFEKLLKVPGIENISLADKCESDYDSIKAKVLEVFDPSKPVFRVSTKRSDKKFPYTSQEFSKLMGGEILKANDGLENMCVSMKNFEQEIGIEILKNQTYVFHKKTQAMGGLPIGTGGKGLVLLSGGIDSPVSAIEAMKRGVKVSCVHFSTPPYTTKESINKVKSLVEVLREFDEDIKFYNFNITDMQLEIKEKCDDRYTLLLMRRMMYRKTSLLCKKLKCKMIITGESIGQVASQTIESITMTNMVSEVPVIRPLITFNKEEIITLAKKYGTYDISIIPFEDACTVFAPKKPETKPVLKDVLAQEEKFDYEKYLDLINLEEEKQKINIEEFI